MSVLALVVIALGIIGLAVIAALATWGIRDMRRRYAALDRPCELVLPDGIVYRVDERCRAIANARIDELMRELHR